LTVKPVRTRISLTLTPVYLDALNRLVEKGLYLEPQDAVRAALRLLFQHHGIEPFTAPEPP